MRNDESRGFGNFGNVHNHFNLVFLPFLAK